MSKFHHTLSSRKLSRREKRYYYKLSATASIMTSIKNELIGSWKHLSFIEHHIVRDYSILLLGKNPYGILMYSSDGYMAVQISKEGRVLYKSNDKVMATHEEMASSLQG